VAGRWVLTSVSQLPKAVDIRNFGADPSASGADNWTALSNAFTAAAILGTGVYVPEGSFTVTGTPLTVPLGVTLFGAKSYGQTATLGSILNFTSGGLVLSYVHSRVERLLLKTGAAAGPAIDIVNIGGSNPAHVHIDCDIINLNTAANMIRCGTTGVPGFLIGAYFRGRWTHAVGATVPGIQIIGKNGSVSNILIGGFRSWAQSDLTASAPFIDVEGQADPGNAGVTNLEIANIVMEQCIAGAIKLRSVSRYIIRNIWNGDVAPNALTAHQIDIGKDAVGAGSPPSTCGEISICQSDVGDATHQSVFCDGTVAGQVPPILFACKFPTIGNNGGSGQSPFYTLGCNINVAYGDAPYGWTGSSLNWVAGTGKTLALTGEGDFNTSGAALAATGLHGALATYAALYAKSQVASQSASNYSAAFGDTEAYINAPTSTGKAGLNLAGQRAMTAYGLDADSENCMASALPIYGDSSLATPSPYGVHGFASVAVTAGGTIVVPASKYKKGILRLTGTASGGAATVQLPIGAYAKLIDNQATGTMTIQGPTGSGVVVGAGKTVVYCDGTNFN
jgi:hypothetical protein